MSKNKEPHFFASDVMSDQRPSPTLSHYLSNFDHAAKKKESAKPPHRTWLLE
jgi:hypothetical protein